MNLTLINYVLMAARRDRFFLSLLCIMILGAVTSFFMSSSAIVEKTEFSIVYLAAAERLLGIIGLVLFVVFFVRRSFESRDVEYLLTRPVSRWSFIFSHSVSFSILSLIISAAVVSSVFFVTHHVNNSGGSFYWAAGVICEYLIVVNVAFFLSMVLSSPVGAALGTLGFYVLGRLMGQLLYISQHPAEIVPAYNILSGIFRLVSMFIPRLDLLAQTSWLLYGPSGAHEFIFIIVQLALFLILILFATFFDLRRRQF